MGDERTVAGPPTSPEIESSDVTITRLEQEKKALNDENVRLRAELAVAKAEAATDKLTGLPTRRVLEGEMERQLARVRRGAATVAAVMIDLDHFKLVNDTWGHGRGDEILKGFADKIKEHKRGADSFGRWGGEEFLAILELPPGTTLEELNEILDRYHKAVTGLDRNPDPDKVEPQTISIGCVLLEANQIATSKEVIDAADKNLYESKNAGRNQSKISAFIENGAETSVAMPASSPEVPTLV